MPRTDIRPALCAAAIAAAGLTAACGGGNDDDRAQPQPPRGIISDRFARTVPLDLKREEFLRRAKVQPARVTRAHQRASKTDVTKLKPAIRRELERKFGKARNGFVSIPARDHQCLWYRGEQPDKYGWRFCFLESTDRLDYLSTTGPLAQSR